MKIVKLAALDLLPTRERLSQSSHTACACLLVSPSWKVQKKTFSVSILFIPLNLIHYNIIVLFIIISWIVIVFGKQAFLWTWYIDVWVLQVHRIFHKVLSHINVFHPVIYYTWALMVQILYSPFADNQSKKKKNNI